MAAGTAPAETAGPAGTGIDRKARASAAMAPAAITVAVATWRKRRDDDGGYG